MSKTKFLFLLFALNCMMLAGCAVKRPQPNAEVNFEVPSKLSIIKKGSLLRIIPSKSSRRETPGFAKELSGRLNKAGYFKVGNGGNPKYVMSLDTFWADRCDNNKEKNYNIRYFAKTKTYKDGSSTDYITHDYGASYTSSLVGAVAIYEVRSIEPLAYFNVSAEDTQWVRSGNKSQAKVACDTRKQRRKLMAEIILNINSLLSQERRNIPVILPTAGDSTAKILLKANKAKQAEKRLQEVIPPAKLSDLTPDLYEKWDEEAEKNETPKRDFSEDLANYYLLNMAKEARGISQESALQIHDAYIAILLKSNDKSLINASADSLARLEETAKRLGIRL